MILFIASIIVAASVVGVFTDSINQVSEAIDQRGISVSQNVRTDVQIISDSGSTAVYDEGTDNITIHVKNTGTETLPADADQIDLFVDGRYETDFEVELLNNASVWATGEVVKMEISPNDAGGLNSGDHRVKLIINEDEEVFEFRL